VVCALILCGLASYSTFAQEERKSEGSVGTSQVHSNDISDHHIPVTLTADDGLAIIAAALDSHVRVSSVTARISYMQSICGLAFLMLTCVRRISIRELMNFSVWQILSPETWLFGGGMWGS